MANRRGRRTARLRDALAQSVMDTRHPDWRAHLPAILEVMSRVSDARRPLEALDEAYHVVVNAPGCCRIARRLIEGAR